MSNLSCPPTSVLQPIIDVDRFAIYQIVAPFYFVISFTNHSILLLAFYKHSKTQPLYMYQVFIAVSETAEIVSNVVYVLSKFVLFSSANPAYQNPVPALNYSYAFVWYTAHLAAPLTNSLITTSLLLSVVMVADRVFALYKPDVYSTIDQKRNQVVAVALSVAFGFGTSAFDCFRYQISSDTTSGSYKVVNDEKYLKTNAALILALSCVLLQAVSLSLLIALSVCLLFLYRSRFVKASVQMSEQKEQRKQSEKTVTLLTLLVCTFDAIEMCMLTAGYIFVYGFPTTYLCNGKLILPLVDTAWMIVKTCDFYAIVIVSKQFRQMLCELLRCGKISKNTVNVTRAPPRNEL